MAIEPKISNAASEQPLKGGLFAAQPGEGGIYLGNVPSVDLVIRAFIDGIPEELAKPGDDLEDLMAFCDRHALRFAMGGPGDALMPNWHDAARLGRYLARRMEVPEEGGLVEILRHAFRKVAEQVIDVTTAQLEGSISVEQAVEALNTLAEEMTAALTGTWELTFPPEEGDEEAA